VKRENQQLTAEAFGDLEALMEKAQVRGGAAPVNNATTQPSWHC
jgi:hypothetical protein